ncbi:hypothetical protein CK5_31140 [Blautia obeum A2-162]|uniref:Uncharacterized protein n=1 Tax=Blautia obeum A2-162 TaxID=657314 RepID=D4LU77_9FIRM|nr:hypothetical protein CK5_31140 [Blautia obeum A2-162]
MHISQKTDKKTRDMDMEI